MKGTRQCWKDATPGMVVVMCVFGICGIDLRLKGGLGTWNKMVMCPETTNYRTKYSCTSDPILNQSAIACRVTHIYINQRTIGTRMVPGYILGVLDGD